MPTTCESIYASLETLFGGIDKLLNIDHQRYQAGGYMDLVVEKVLLGETPIFSFAHYFEQNGDLCCDPEMTLRIDAQAKTAEALSFQMAMPPQYKEVFDENGEINHCEQAEQNEFLLTWLKNMLAAKYTPRQTVE